MSSKINIISYCNSLGFISRSWDRRNPPRTIAHCGENPKDLFEALYPEYFITKFRGFEIFPTDPEDFFPMVGLEIADYHLPAPVYGLFTQVTGDLSGLRQVLEQDFEAKRLARGDYNLQEEIDFILELQAPCNDPNRFIVDRQKGKIEVVQLKEIKDLVRNFK
jgi:hypothetical protein